MQFAARSAIDIHTTSAQYIDYNGEFLFTFIKSIKDLIKVQIESNQV